MFPPSMAFYLSVEDPENIGVVADAYCVLTEVHSNFKTRTLAAVFECWRSKEACEAKKSSFNAITVEMTPENGGNAYFEQNGLDGAKLTLAPILRDFCLDNAESLAEARPAEMGSGE